MRTSENAAPKTKFEKKKKNFMQKVMFHSWDIQFFKILKHSINLKSCDYEYSHFRVHILNYKSSGQVLTYSGGQYFQEKNFACFGGPGVNKERKVDILGKTCAQLTLWPEVWSKIMIMKGK